ncbi:MAG TPA: hypothetical protein EYN67_09645 [Flavobacteriales bacterium]|jgi:hypothetical protein|nr:hypothetical protein [Flavobacteriales bacterium]HIN89103.1 hypothetical protein [Porticoccaceae bacterium]
MKIHFYTLCKDEEELLPHVLKHYEQFVEKIVVFVNIPIHDRSIEIIDAHHLCARHSFDTQGKLRDDIHVQIKNYCWKESAGEADWVIVADMDELLFHENLFDYLKECSKEGITVPLTQGVEMFADQMPKIGTRITDQITAGVHSQDFSKSIIFDPNKIEEISYEAGAHICWPEGYVKYSKTAELKVLHYKYIGGLARLKRRWNTMGDSLSQENIDNGWGVLRKDENELVRLYNMIRLNAGQVL